MTAQMIYHVGFIVDDLEKSLEWYTNVLGLQVEREIREVSGEWISAVTGFENTRLKMVWVGTGNGCSIELDQYVTPPGSDNPPTSARNDVRASHVGIQVDDVHAEYQRMSKLGVKFAGPPPVKLDNEFPWANCAVFLQDPDGNWIELLERNPPPAG
jgi:catechol 2,3-dioxygenase-like lactoylglutathione lyase family enzyme